ncbi:hypothetical protein Vretimale_174 [Volvox reticuliferus]|uniref:Uncharacterized protein n=1 Tax=Volvox reticuliferus TaxID=1737510 RepID=A0A8J4G0S3_9CHLO|nr:hypothetical protein Vretimale_174 [Volvox reticuliferus]
MVRVMQLLLQHQQFQLEQGLGVQQQLMEEQVSTLGVLQMIPHLDIKDVGEGLNKLQGEFFKVADADMDAMFAQVRTEERTGARDTLANNVDQIKQPSGIGQKSVRGNTGARRGNHQCDRNGGGHSSRVGAAGRSDNLSRSSSDARCSGSRKRRRKRLCVRPPAHTQGSLRRRAVVRARRSRTPRVVVLRVIGLE